MAAGRGYANEQRLLGPNLSDATLSGGGRYALKISDISELTEDGRVVFALSETATGVTSTPSR